MIKAVNKYLKNALWPLVSILFTFTRSKGSFWNAYDGLRICEHNPTHNY